MRAAIALTLLLSAAAAVCSADVIDRIAVSIDNTVIPLSEVLRQIRITALMNGEEPVFTADSKREAAERLVNQALIRREIAISRYVPDNTEQAEILYKNFRTRHPADAQYKATLAKYNVSDADIRAAFTWQATFLDFVEVRFRPGITIPEDEIRSAYDEQIKGKSSPEATLSFEEARPKLEEQIMQQRADNALDRWLGQAMTQSRIVYRREALQ